MSKQSARVTRRVISQFRGVELLDQRAYLNGIELSAPISSPLGGLSPTSISMTTASGANADFNGDGKTDLVISDFADNKVVLYLGSGNGTFQLPVTAPLPAVSTVHAVPVAIADMNGDGKWDIVCGDPGTPGNYYIVANANGVLPPASSTSAINVQPATTSLPKITLQNLWAGATGNILQHGKIDFYFQIQNNGTAIAKGALLADLVAASQGYGTISPMTQKIRVNIAPGQKQMIHLRIAPRAVPSGSYDLSLTLNPLKGFEGANFTSNTVTGTNSITL